MKASLHFVTRRSTFYYYSPNLTFYTMKDIFMYGMQFNFTLWPGSVQVFDFLIKTIRHYDVTFSKNQQNYHQMFIYLTHTLNKSNPSTTNPMQKTPNTAHCRQSVKQTIQKSWKGRRAHSAWQKQKWSAERYELSSAGDEGQTGSWASNARRNRNVTNGKSSEQPAT